MTLPTLLINMVFDVFDGVNEQFNLLEMMRHPINMSMHHYTGYLKHVYKVAANNTHRFKLMVKYMHHLKALFIISLHKKSIYTAVQYQIIVSLNL